MRLDLVLGPSAEVAEVGPQGWCSGQLTATSAFIHQWLAVRLCSDADVHLAASYAQVRPRQKAVGSRQFSRPFPDICWRHDRPRHKHRPRHERLSCEFASPSRCLDAAKCLIWSSGLHQALWPEEKLSPAL